MDLVLIKSFTYSYETTNAIGVLELNNIDYYLQESTISNTFHYLGQGSNGIRLYVDKEDELKAKNILIEAGILNKEDLVNTPIDLNKFIRKAVIRIGITLLILLAIYLKYKK